MKSVLIFTLSIVALIPLIANANFIENEAREILNKIRGDVESFHYNNVRFNNWAIVSYKKKSGFLHDTYLFKVKTDKGHLKIKVIKMRDGRIRLGSVEVVKENHILNFC